MGSADFYELTGSLSSGSVARGVTSGVARPNGGGTFVYAMNSLAVVNGAVALSNNQTNFDPMAKGGSVRGAIQRGLSGGPTNFSPFFFVGAQGPTTTDLAYLLGLSDEEPHRIVLRKGMLGQGIPAAAPGSQGVLARSTATYVQGTWLHLRLDVVVNANNDVILNCYANDLNANPVTAPVWAAIPGIANFTDDALGINSGTAPFTSGRAGWGAAFLDITRRVYVDEVAILRQT